MSSSNTNTNNAEHDNKKNPNNNPTSPSIRLRRAGGNNEQPGGANKKLKLDHVTDVPNIPVPVTTVYDMTLHHQITCLRFGFDDGNGWYNGNNNCISTLYITTASKASNDTAAATTVPSSLSQSDNQQQQEIALHLRKSCHVENVTIELIDGTDNAEADKLVRIDNTKYYHVDPIQHVLVKPTTSLSKKNEFDADTQCSRGASGMTTSLRAASIASNNHGELHIHFQPPKLSSSSEVPPGNNDPNNNNADAEAQQRRTQIWKKDILETMKQLQDGKVYERLDRQLAERQHATRGNRLNRIVDKLSSASANNAYKVTIKYQIVIPTTSCPQQLHHLGGLHVINGGGNSSSPHIYTTCGVYGDSEGSRCYMPTLDSASVQHRSTHYFVVSCTSQIQYGLSVVGFGQDFGTTETIVYDKNNISNNDAVKEELGSRVPQIMNNRKGEEATTTTTTSQNAAHVIPEEEGHHHHHPSQTGSSSSSSLEDIYATTIWATQSWIPIPSRSIGFAIGPFKIIEDPEYFGGLSSDDVDDDDDDDHEEPSEDRHARYLENARKCGEGIRQVYFAPLFERKHIHLKNNASTHLLLPKNTTFRIAPLTMKEQEISKQLDQAVIASTVGVPHRALSLMRDVLALPTYRTTSYTQIWIPGAVHGGCTSGALHCCPEVLINPFLGGSIMDSRLLSPVNARLPYYQGGRVLQFLQARNAVRGWVIAALPLGGSDDVGTGYLLSLIESFVMSLYERGHGGQGEGGAKGSFFFSKRYSSGCGLNSANLDFLPVQNVEDADVVIDGIGAVPVEDRHNEQLWRGANNGSESHTSAMDEFNARQLLLKDSVEALERGTDKDKGVPSPSMGWFGSYLSLTFLSSNATSSSDVGCGAVELLHPVGGLLYRSLKSDLFRGVVEGRAGVANFIRLIRAAFIAAHLEDIGEKELRLPKKKKKTDKPAGQPKDASTDSQEESSLPKPPFVVCVNEILKKRGLTHTLFTRALQNLSGRIKEPQLLGTLVDAERHAEDPRTRRPFVDPEGFPNSYVRGSSLLFCRIGVQVETARDSTQSQSSSVAKGIQMEAYAEPVIPEGGIAYGGPITVRVVENEGSFREFVKDLAADGSRRDWGATFLHAKPVTTSKAQTAASGTIENSNTAKEPSKAQSAKVSTLDAPVTSNAFTETDFHMGGYQAIELIRLTNLTPLLWVRVDPMGLYGGRISVFQPDACLAEQLFHDGDAEAQIDAIRALAERPLRIQSFGKVTTVYDVGVSELPVRVLGDCLRGTPALHSSLPHTPAVRAQAALAIAQWQNNKGPSSKDAVGAENWVGINILVQYFRERFYSNSVVMPNKFSRLVLQKNETEVHKAKPYLNPEGGAAPAQPSYDDTYQYLDAIEEEDRKDAVASAEAVEMEEDEEYRVRSAAVTAIACVRAKDGLTPLLAIQFLEAVIESEDAEIVGNLAYSDEELLIEEMFRRAKVHISGETADDDENNEGVSTSSLSYISSRLVADALLALCHVNSMPAIITDPTTGKAVQSSGTHPLNRLLKAAKSWLDWELYREKIRLELAQETESGVSGNCHDLIATCAIIALSNLAILIQSTTDETMKDPTSTNLEEEVASAKFYSDIFDLYPQRNDLLRAACAQALSCICCAADRFQKDGAHPVGLLTSLEFLLQRIVETTTSPSLRHTLALIMMDACTGKVCSMQRIGAIAGRNDLVFSVARFLNGPLGACHGGDNGSAILTAVSATTFPAACAVNDGARRGMRLLSRAGHPKEKMSEQAVVRVARFATRLWRTINGEPPDVPEEIGGTVGVCAYDGILRCSLLALWQWIWPRGCFAVLQVQSWRALEKTQKYRDMGAQHVMKISDEDKAAASAEESSLSDLSRLVEIERDRQVWRGEMARKAYDIYKASNRTQDVAASEKGTGKPLPPIARDTAFKQGGWIASHAQQRRAMGLDGGTAVNKVRLKVKSERHDG